MGVQSLLEGVHGKVGAQLCRTSLLVHAGQPSERGFSRDAATSYSKLSMDAYTTHTAHASPLRHHGVLTVPRVQQHQQRYDQAQRPGELALGVAVATVAIAAARSSEPMLRAEGCKRVRCHHRS